MPPFQGLYSFNFLYYNNIIPSGFGCVNFILKTITICVLDQNKLSQKIALIK